MSSLLVEQLSVSYGRRAALHPVDELVGSGEWLGLVGPNGAGKSSMLRALAGLVAADGVITVGSVALSSIRSRERAQLVAYVPQEPLIPDDMRVTDYVLLGRTPYLGYFGSLGSEDRAIADRVLARLELDSYAERLLGELSGGERQRVVLARALAQEAPILLLDEPTSALDIGHQQQALDLVADLRTERGLTVVSAMHDLTLAGLYTDRLIMLDEGRAVARGSAAEVLTAERLASVYRANVRVQVDDDGSVIVVPQAPSNLDRSA